MKIHASFFILTIAMLTGCTSSPSQNIPHVEGVTGEAAGVSQAQTCYEIPTVPIELTVSESNRIGIVGTEVKGEQAQKLAQNYNFAITALAKLNARLCEAYSKGLIDRDVYLKELLAQAGAFASEAGFATRVSSSDYKYKSLSIPDDPYRKR
jgi:hypothetical protein